MGRATIELPDDLLDALRAEVSRRGLSGYSQIIEEALRARFPDRERLARVRRALTAGGSLSEEDAAEMLAVVRDSRATWRKRK